MGKNSMTTDFLKECMSDSLLKLMRKKDFSKITVDVIAAGAGVNRSTWFRNYTTKNEALTFKLVKLWDRWADEYDLSEKRGYNTDNAQDFFRFNYENRTFLKTIRDAGLKSAIYDAFYSAMMPLFQTDVQGCYFSRFYSYGLFGLLDEWISRDFLETPDKMTEIFNNII